MYLPAAHCEQLVFAARDAPGQLPSVYLAELESKGWTVVDNIMSPPVVEHLKANITAVRERNAECDLSTG